VLRVLVALALDRGAQWNITGSARTALVVHGIKDGLLLLLLLLLLCFAGPERAYPPGR
jgi:hypothetical protein